MHTAHSTHTHTQAHTSTQRLNEQLYALAFALMPVIAFDVNENEHE